MRKQWHWHELVDLDAKRVKPDLRGKPISNAEMRVIEQAALGKSNPQIARALRLKENTIKTHLYHIAMKLHTSSRLSTVLKWVEHKHQREMAELRNQLANEKAAN